MAQRDGKGAAAGRLSPNRRTVTEKEHIERRAARPEDDFAQRVADLKEGQIYNVSSFSSGGRGARPLLKRTAEQRGYYFIPEAPELYSDNRLTLELALKNLGKWSPKIERSVESAFAARRGGSPVKPAPRKASPKQPAKKASPKKVSPKQPAKKVSPKQPAKKASPKKASPKPAVRPLPKPPVAKPKGKETPVEAEPTYEVKVEGRRAKISPRRFPYKVTEQGLVFQ